MDVWGRGVMQLLVMSHRAVVEWLRLTVVSLQEELGGWTCTRLGRRRTCGAPGGRPELLGDAQGRSGCNWCKHASIHWKMKQERGGSICAPLIPRFLEICLQFDQPR